MGAANYKLEQELMDGMKTAFWNEHHTSNLAFRPELISNDYKQGRKVLATIEDELKKCEEFYISVAFITMSGITPLLQILKELEEKNIKGKILTTDYLTFSDPKALEKLASLKNIELRMYCSANSDSGFHTKGYIFKKEPFYNMIIGSSNVTLGAITKNKEWNTKLVSGQEGSFAKQVLEEFNGLWTSPHTRSFEDVHEQYQTLYNIVKEQKRLAKNEIAPSFEMYQLRPNKMQVSFIHNLEKMVDDGAQRALLLSATGTGKTYASAFAIRNMNSQKVLFLVHREQIAKQALHSYRRVFGKSKTFGLLSGNQRELDKDFIFSTMQMMAKEEIRTQFNKEEFDVIIIDEAHRSGARSYQDIMNYFNPKLWLGMTASPERSDEFDVFSAFDHNIAYEIRLWQAMEEDLLCPFHYYGIQDMEVDGYSIDEKTQQIHFGLLTSDERVSHILAKADYFGHSGDRVKGLVFCSTKREAKELSAKFNQRGYRTVALTGEHSQEKREEAVERLVSDIREDILDYIFTVDIFNEGVDIPQINQVIMLRPTQSPIVFVQQLGRGLRKAEDKEFVVIIDFIGNYKNNFMIPIALSGDRSYNKDSIRKYVAQGNRMIPGSSTIHFDEITRKRIYESIDTSNFNDVRLIKESYQQLKFKLGRIPNLLDFDEHGEVDVLRIFENQSLGSYYKFLVKYEKEYTIRISSRGEKFLEYISKKFASGKRIHELLLLKRLLAYQGGVLGLWKKELMDAYQIESTPKTQQNVVNILTNQFATGSGKTTYQECIFIEKEGADYRISDAFGMELRDTNFYSMVQEVIAFGIYRNQTYYSERHQGTTFQLYAKYTYEDVCRLLEWEKGEVALNIGGYRYDSKTKTYPVFINYNKEDGIQDTVKYEDRFVDPSTLIAISKSGRTTQSQDVKVALQAQELGVQMELFVRKNKDDKTSKEFYYLGKIKATGRTHEFIMSNTTKTAVEIEYALLTPVQEDVYDYITN